MKIETKDAVLQDAPLLDAVHESLIQRDFLLQLRKIDHVLLRHVASSTNFMSYVEQMTASLGELFPSNIRPCVLWCDKDLTHWRILNYKDWPALSDALGNVSHIPQPLATFVASPSRPFAREQNLPTRSDWSQWQDVLAEHFLDTCDLVSVQDNDKNWFTFCLFSSKLPSDSEHRMHYWAVDQALQSIPQWLKAMLVRMKTDARLQEHTNEVTGLLQPHAFDNALDMMLRDARRYFQRLAFVSVLVPSDADQDELKLLSDTLRETLRDNDLLANSSDNEFVMAMRIMQLDDAPIVAQKVQKALQKADPKQISVLSGGIKIGVALYPEQANQDKLRLASLAAANAVTENVGYRLEYYGKFVKNLDEAYDD
ncbi:GGDEF domain protein [Marinomonas aquimarina]|uniref:GGDEF domain protein n=1 Tax=Marinomonas aquimarina TaxID=295068 RepID=A0A1A8THS8_9GAMM|nr:diguanylate cyclase [Marinomonas aquimarina]SBS32828.1 GGDEF domain protein [Marinomonas aquimarina]